MTSQVSLGSTRAQTIDVFPPQHSGLPGRAGVQVYMLRPHPHTHPFVHTLTLTHLRHIWNIPEKETTDTAFAWKAGHSPEGEIAGERRNWGVVRAQLHLRGEWNSSDNIPWMCPCAAARPEALWRHSRARPGAEAALPSEKETTRWPWPCFSTSKNDIGPTLTSAP